MLNLLFKFKFNKIVNGNNKYDQQAIFYLDVIMDTDHFNIIYYYVKYY